METAIRWSPSSTLSAQRFLFADVSGRSFYLGIVESYKNSKVEYSRSDTYANVPPFRALDWSPFDESLVAVGTPSGEAVLLKIDGSGPSTGFPARYQRPCNAVAVSKHGLLAAGLERVRNDFCLNVWDAHAQGSSVGGTETVSARGNYVEPVRKFASSEAVSSIKFFSSQPDIMVVGVKGFGIRCYDVRDSSSNPNLQFITKCVHNIAIDPLNEVHFACAGPLKDTTIQIWDVRSGSPHTPPPLGMRRGTSLTSNNDNGTHQEPLITFEDVFNDGIKNQGEDSTCANIWSLRYCKGKTGFLGALANNGDFRVFETQKAFTKSDGSSIHGGNGSAVIDEDKDVAEPILTRRVHRLERPFDHSRQTSGQKERIVSFDFTNLAGPQYQPTVLVLRGDNSIAVRSLSVPSSGLSISASCNLAVLDGSSTTTTVKGISKVSSIAQDGARFHLSTEIDHNSEQRKRQWLTIMSKKSGQKPEILVNHDEVHVSSFERHERLFRITQDVSKLSASDALALTNIARTRCGQGYGLDCDRNIEIVSENQWLQDMWRWIARAKKHTDDGTLALGPLELSYLGVQRLWNQDLGNIDGSRNDSSNFANVIRRLARDLRLSGTITAETRFPEHRHLCLYTLGFSFNEQQLASEVIHLARDGKQTKAASLALLLSHHKLAATALKTGRLDAHHRALSIAVAGYVKGSTDDSWNDVVQAVLQDVTDPNARSILALVKRGDWRDVLKEVSLPLKDRVGTALLHLSDTDLTNYINEATTAAVREGDIEGITLTGLTERGVNLFENYILKFSDLQTAVLALSHASPRYFRDTRVDAWREEYRSWIDAWNMYAERARFDIRLRELSTASDDESRLSADPPQVTLLCTYCERSLIGQAEDDSRDDSTTSSFGSGKSTIFGDARFGTMCPSCGHHLPRCVICEHWLGMPDPDLKFGAIEQETMSRAETTGKMTVVCAQCSHMTHLAHAQEWFSRFSECPERDCNCQCMGLEGDI